MKSKGGKEQKTEHNIREGTEGKRLEKGVKKEAEGENGGKINNGKQGEEEGPVRGGGEDQEITCSEKKIEVTTKEGT